MSNFTEGKDFYYNEEGFVVLTSGYHLKRGRCCGSGCLHCPYDYKLVPEPRRTELLTIRPPVILMTAPEKNDHGKDIE